MQRCFPINILEETIFLVWFKKENCNKLLHKDRKKKNWDPRSPESTIMCVEDAYKSNH
jgi:hypothetical protein